LSDQELTNALVLQIMGWKCAPGRFIKPNRGWTPQWKFQPLKKPEHALELLDKAAPQLFTMEGDVKKGFHVKVRIAGVTGEARGQSKAKTISYAIARAIGITVPPAVDQRKSSVASQMEGA
jgi:hypothetical protein